MPISFDLIYRILWYILLPLGLGIILGLMLRGVTF